MTLNNSDIYFSCLFTFEDHSPCQNLRKSKRMTQSWECTALDGERVPHGENFVPGPDYCTACKCEKGEAKFCRAALCQPPQDCKSFRVGESCCEFICLDDILPTRNNEGNSIPSDTGLRMVASAITAILSLALLLFLIHRLRQRKLRTAQHQYFEDQFESMGGAPPEACRNNSCCHNAMYLSGNDHVDFFLDGYTPPYSPWKPPSYYFPHREAPPSYSEAIAGDRILTAHSEGVLPALSPLMVELTSSLAEIQASHRVSVSLRNSVIVSEALAQAGANDYLREEAGAVALSQSNCSFSNAILSDQLYENTPLSDNATDTHRGSNAPTAIIRALHELNKEAIGATAMPDQDALQSIKGVEPNISECHRDGSYVLENHNGCSSDTKDTQPSVRARQKACLAQVPVTDSKSVVEDFRLRLQLDISDSSSSTECPSHPLSVGSISSGSSEDVPSIRSNEETNC